MVYKKKKEHPLNLKKKKSYQWNNLSSHNDVNGREKLAVFQGK